MEEFALDETAAGAYNREEKTEYKVPVLFDIHC